MTDRSLWTVVTVIGLAVPLCFGCVTLLPKKVPEALYRFGGDIQPPAGTPAGTAGGRAATLGITVTLPVAAQGDTLLALSGSRAAYISGGRWVVPAADLFREAAVRALAGRGPVGHGPARLTLTVTRFETEYDRGLDAPPTVRIDAVLLWAGGRRDARTLGAVRGEARAAENRIGAIVVAYDTALEQVLTATAAAVDREAQSADDDRPDQRDQANSGLPVRPR
jgi:cholesterol transport system auxiliary component